jgi:hypothetical protein
MHKTLKTRKKRKISQNPNPNPNENINNNTFISLSSNIFSHHSISKPYKFSISSKSS